MINLLRWKVDLYDTSLCIWDGRFSKIGGHIDEFVYIFVIFMIGEVCLSKLLQDCWLASQEV
jgi:hypothetical protein